MLVGDPHMPAERDNIIFRQCVDADFDSVYFIINEAAAAYDALIPPEHNVQPYMSRDEFRTELVAGVDFWGYEENGALRAVMGIQRVLDVVLIRHAYTRPEYQGSGIGGGLLNFLLARTRRPVLVGTWAGIVRAHRFYTTHGFRLVPENATAGNLAPSSVPSMSTVVTRSSPRVAAVVMRARSGPPRNCAARSGAWM